MKSFFDNSTLQEFTQRLDKLSPNAPAQWGKMNVSQMLAHCNAAMEVALGDIKPKRSFLGLVIGKLAKPMLTNDVPFKPNMPTDKGFIITGSRDFEKERQKLVGLITRFSKGGASTMERRVHPFFGLMTPEEWSTSQVKHLDHHFRQFGA